MNKKNQLYTFIASIQLDLVSSFPASIIIETGVPSDLIEFIVKLYSEFLRNVNEDDGDFVSFGAAGHSSSSVQFGQLIVVCSVIKQSPFKV